MPIRYRHRIFLTLCVMVAAGILSRAMPLGWRLWDKYLGDAVYAAVFYLGLSLIWPAGGVRTKTVLTLLYVVGIELFQLTPAPAQLNRHPNGVVRLFAYGVLGSRFGWWDLVAYGAGIMAIVWIDRRYLGAKSK